MAGDVPSSNRPGSNSRDASNADAERSFAPGHDPRLEIPEILRTPIDHPSKHAPKPSKVASSMGGLGDLSKALAIGLDFLFTTAAGGAVGWGIDYWQKWSPYGLLIGGIIGFTFATVRMLKRLNKEDAPKSGAKNR